MTGRPRLLLALVAGFLLLQVVPPEQTNPPVTGEIAAPPEIAPLLRRACYDCHSNETVWPWYGRVAPVSWLLAHDVGEGREELNFSTWAAYDAGRRRKKLRKCAEEVAEGEMPLWYYLVVHPEARLTSGEAERLRAWALAEAGAAGN